MDVMDGLNYGSPVFPNHTRSHPHTRLVFETSSITVMLLKFLTGLFVLGSIASAQLEPLHTSSRWIMDSNNKRFKFRCINWAGHMEANIPEGLQHQPVEAIARLVSDSGFNCVRLTFSIDMALHQDQKVSESFSTLADRAGAPKADVDSLWSRVKEKNPWIEMATVSETFGKVIDTLGTHNLRVILDNHVSKASWCCSLEDGNGWWDKAPGYVESNSRNFKTDDWLKGLAAMASFSAKHPAVAGIGLRNEIREVPVVQSRDAWYTFIPQGADAVHNANKDLLIIMGGTYSSQDASFLRSKPLDRSRWAGKIVWEWHHYTFSIPWITSFKNCFLWKQQVGAYTGFLLTQNQDYTGPLWLSEFGFGMTGGPPERHGIGSQEDYDYLNCLVEYVTGNDGDWALWALQGNYYVRDGVVDKEEGWGLVNKEWTAWRNTEVKGLLGKMWDVTQGP
ncbi:cellulase [Lojkania enalia]|uniref:Cellulase n=1 Tax=Lojkania enalia TaxID=147567 RepID=A0A9P4MYT7_9PLEO|nr:cellulase [Didymosphaeria enalia]